MPLEESSVQRTFKDAERRIHQASKHYLIGTRTIN